MQAVMFSCQYIAQWLRDNKMVFGNLCLKVFSIQCHCLEMILFYFSVNYLSTVASSLI